MGHGDSMKPLDDRIGEIREGHKDFGERYSRHLEDWRRYEDALGRAPARSAERAPASMADRMTPTRGHWG